MTNGTWQIAFFNFCWKDFKIWWFFTIFSKIRTREPWPVLGNFDLNSETLCTVIVYSWPVLRNLDPYLGTLKLTCTRLCSQVPHSRQFTMSHGSYDSNLGSKRLILDGDIRSKSWPNIDLQKYSKFPSTVLGSRVRVKVPEYGFWGKITKNFKMSKKISNL